MPVNFVNIPDVLKQTASFCVWKMEKRSGRPTKVPYNPRTGAMARTNDPSTFTDFNTAMKSYAIGGWDGIGYRVSEGIRKGYPGCRPARKHGDSGRAEPA